MHDVFISYRHNDDRLDGWVTAFAAALQMELRANIKQPVSVFFDQDPSQGLREHHAVAASLDGRLRAHIFLPILSQTYCDPAGYAWHSEFLPFLAQERAALRPLEVPLASGNRASRVLPVCIHELDDEDIRTLEAQLGGPLRSIDFSYREEGANRALSMQDQEAGHARPGARYRNQLNKTALAIKELLTVLRHQSSAFAPSPAYGYTIPVAAVDRRVVSLGSVPAPATIAQTVSGGGPTVYLAYTSQELRQRREDMALMLANAGFGVLPAHDAPADDDAFKQVVTAALAQAQLSLHLLGHEYGRRFEEDDAQSFPAWQHAQAAALAEAGALRQMSWYLQDATRPLKPDQATLLANIRNTLSERTHLSNASEATQLVEELRAMAALDLKAEEATTTGAASEIFFVYNLQDYGSAEALTDTLSSTYPLEIMVIEPETASQARAASVGQMKQSRMAVVFFKNAADWAVPFVKEVWKDLGGAASPTQLILLGDDDPRTNLLRTFKAPRVVSRIVHHAALAQEVAAQYEARIKT